LDGEFMWNGFMGRYMNFNIYSSNNVMHTCVLTSSAAPTATNTVVIAWVTFTFVSSIGSTAGNVLFTDEATSLDNLAAALNAWSWAGTTYVEVSAANRLKLNMLWVVATSDSTHTVTVKTQWPTTYTETHAAATWGTQVANCLFGKMSTIDMVIQREPTVQQNKVPDKTGYNYLVYDLYGIKTFTEWANRNMNVKIAV
jgi:hypothetical protein